MKIKNVAIAAHVDSGKTTLTEQLLLLSGSIRAAGRVDLGTAKTDDLEVEKRRGISVRSSYASFIKDGYKINLIDTPGHADFSAEVDRTLCVSDGALLALSSVEGVQAHTKALFSALAKLSLPTVIFINKIDRSLSDVDRVFESLCDNFDGHFIKICEPVGEQSAECSVRFAEGIYDTLTDALSLYDDEICEKLLEGERIDSKTLTLSLAKCVKERKIFPVFCGSALLSVGMDILSDAMISLLPSSDEVGKNEDSAVIFGIEHDSAMGRLAHVRTYGRELSSRDTVTYPDSREEEKISQIRSFSGVKRIDSGFVGKGDIATVFGLQSARLFDYIGNDPHLLVSDIACPFLSVKAYSDSTEITELLKAFRELEAENPLLSVKWESTEREIVISITGKIQTEVLSELLLSRYGYKVKFSEPSVIYKETPKKAAYGFDAYTMPKPCWAIVKLLIEPLKRGSGVVWDGGNVPHNKLFYKYQEHIKRSFFESLEQGLMGWEVTDIKATLVDGEHHTIHTHPLDFFVATPLAFMQAMKNAGSTLLEPMLNVKINVPSEFVGKVMSDTLKMRGEFDSPVIKKDIAYIECMLPVSESMDYPTELARLTSGLAVYYPSFGGYREMENTVITTPRRGADPLDRPKWILYKRGAMQ